MYGRNPRAKGQKVNSLEKKVDNMENKLDEIMKLLENTQNTSKPGTPPQEHMDNKEKLESIKPPISKPLLIVKDCENEEQNKSSRVGVEKAIMDNNIPVSKSFRNKSGDLVVVLESQDKLNELKELDSSANSDIIIDTNTKINISILGLQEEYKIKKKLSKCSLFKMDSLKVLPTPMTSRSILKLLQFVL